MLYLVNYAVVIVFQIFGVSFKVLDHIRGMRKDIPGLTPKQAWSAIKEKDWDTLFCSLIILLLDLCVHAVMDIRQVPKPELMQKWWFDMVSSAVLGYAGQEIAFRALGTAKAKALELAGGKKSTTLVQEETPDQTKTTVISETTTPKS